MGARGPICLKSSREGPQATQSQEHADIQRSLSLMTPDQGYLGRETQAGWAGAWGQVVWRALGEPGGAQGRGAGGGEWQANPAPSPAWTSGWMGTE